MVRILLKITKDYWKGRFEMNLLKKMKNRLHLFLEFRKFSISRVKTIRLLTESSSNLIKSYQIEVEKDYIFLKSLREKFKENFIYAPSRTDFFYSSVGGSIFFPFVTLYILTRLLKPNLVVETGGTPGKSSCFILRAMERNGAGKLFTIDLPPDEVVPKKSKGIGKSHEVLPEGENAGWLIPEWLKGRHTLLKGPSKVHLPTLLEKLETIDIFIHDSDHSYENMMWEFKAAWPHLKNQGLLIADDIGTHTAFPDFCESVKGVRFFIANYGIIRKK